MQGARVDSFMVGDDWQVEPSLNLISCRGAAVNLSPRAMDLLVYMSSRSGDVISVDDIVENIWAGIFVADGSIYNCVYELRQALGDDPNEPKYIETISKRGYRFVANVVFPKSASKLRRRDDDRGISGSLNKPGKASVLAGLLAAVLVIVAYWVFLAPDEATGPARDIQENSIAVMPFLDLSPNGDQAYFADGIAEELLNTLAGIEGLRVTGRTSSFAFRGKEPGVQEIGRALGVASILEGSVRMEGNRVRIAVQLIAAADGFNLWSETYERDLNSVLAVQREIALAVVEALEIELGISGEKAIAVLASGDPMAYQAYLRGRYFWNQRSPEALLKAIGYFERAIEIAPEYAAAYHGLADAHLVLLVTGQYPLSFSDRFELGRAANEKALELDPDFGPAYSTLAFVNVLRFRLDETISNAEKAITLAPNYPTAHQWLAVDLTFLGYPGKALPIMRRAMALDPLSIIINLSYGSTLFAAGRHAEAIAQYKETITLAPDFEWAWFSLGMAYLHLGRFDEARGVAGDIEDTAVGVAFGSWIDLIEGKTALGEDDPEVDRLITESEIRQETLVALLVMAGFNNRAMGYFEESAKAGLLLMPPLGIGSDPIIRRLFVEPRMQAFLRDMGFVDYWREHGWPDNCHPADIGEIECD